MCIINDNTEEVWWILWMEKMQQVKNNKHVIKEKNDRKVPKRINKENAEKGQRKR